MGCLVAAWRRKIEMRSEMCGPWTEGISEHVCTNASILFSGSGVGPGKIQAQIHAPWASHCLSASSASLGCWEDKRKGVTMYATLCALEERQY